MQWMKSRESQIWPLAKPTCTPRHYLDTSQTLSSQSNKLKLDANPNSEAKIGLRGDEAIDSLELVTISAIHAFSSPDLRRMEARFRFNAWVEGEATKRRGKRAANYFLSSSAKECPSRFLRSVWIVRQHYLCQIWAI